MRRNRSGVLGAVLIALVLVAAACGSGEEAETKDGPTINVGSGNFPESNLLGEIYAQVLESEGYPVERNLNIGNREIYAAALEGGQLDLVPEYVGSALIYKNGTPSADTDATAAALREVWADDGIAVLDPAPAEDKNGLVIRQDTADELGISKTSDLADHPELVLGGPPECPERELCLIGFTDVYGLTFADFKPLDLGGPLTVAALERDEIQVALMFTSQGVIAAKGFVLLEDDKGLQPADNVTPVIRQEILDAYGDGVAEALNRVSAELELVELIEMNRRMSVDRDDPELVAADWIAANL